MCPWFVVGVCVFGAHHKQGWFVAIVCGVGLLVVVGCDRGLVGVRFRWVGGTRVHVPGLLGDELVGWLVGWLDTFLV